MNCPSCGAVAAPGIQFCEACGAPLTGAPSGAAPAGVRTAPQQSSPMSATTFTAPQAASYAPPPPAKSGGHGCLWAGIAAAVIGGLLIIIIGLGAAGWWYYKNKMPNSNGDFSSSTPTSSTPASPDASSTAASTTDASSTPATAGVVKIVLSWDQAVDMDLEIWNASGENLLKRAFNLCGEDVKDGNGTEWFEFKDYGNDHFSTGRYIVSLYFANRPEGSTVSQATATLTITKADGTTETRQKTISWEPGRDQWHAFSIDAATGNIRNKDQFIRVQQQNNN